MFRRIQMRRTITDLTGSSDEEEPPRSVPRLIDLTTNEPATRRRPRGHIPLNLPETSDGRIIDDTFLWQEWRNDMRQSAFFRTLIADALDEGDTDNDSIISEHRAPTQWEQEQWDQHMDDVDTGWREEPSDDEDYMDPRGFINRPVSTAITTPSGRTNLQYWQHRAEVTRESANNIAALDVYQRAFRHNFLSEIGLDANSAGGYSDDPYHIDTDEGSEGRETPLSDISDAQEDMDDW